ncbi:hypothetical protein BDV38DRAFT_255607 [Aspergillus pseudotamarii]|uniref:Uncharacterized protein n=1 Tax=Aspergillus pseudotamarii TaxID=132259 RepID=A0A5N6SI02_ASPPS|nr:uncharacterized protein BDV38DRAFT_255607 [Aspergillus pseudotamarii]KAE8134316.1 hypothetical protein BDV38DRAFT_255607 [Aspergillus pseudotamarii]
MNGDVDLVEGVAEPFLFFFMPCIGVALLQGVRLIVRISWLWNLWIRSDTRVVRCLQVELELV